MRIFNKGASLEQYSNVLVWEPYVGAQGMVAAAIGFYCEL